MALTMTRLLNRAVYAGRRWIQERGGVHPGTDLADTFGTFGAGSYLGYPVSTIYGARAIHLGEGTLVGPESSLLVGYSPDDPNLPERGLVIGDRCVIGARATITAHSSIVIGSNVWFGRDVFISDASHGYQDPETPIGEQLGVAEPISIGEGSWIGHGVVVLPGTIIGRHVVVGAGSVVRGTIGDHCVVAGVPAKVVRRLEGAGWVSTSRPQDVRPAWTAADVAELLSDH